LIEQYKRDLSNEMIPDIIGKPDHGWDENK